ncbi:hypothetical protein [Microbacterium sp. NPDC087592]|uniref:hypothetical protein n=1 Tax=Microbacterium sp. NPDC087592 TaxID=3364193 RepID=UPI00381D04F6
MEWWGWIGWGVGVLGGAYGTVQSFLTARALRAVAVPWTVTTSDNVNFIFTNLSAYTARDIRLEVPHGMLYGPPGTDGPMAMPGQPETLRPNETFRANFANPFGVGGETMTITWRPRFGLRREFVMRIPTI